jgi:hypothetical protein
MDQNVLPAIRLTRMSALDLTIECTTTDDGMQQFQILWWP